MKFSLPSTEKLYREPVLRAPTLQRLSEIARGLGLDMEESELIEYRGKLDCSLAKNWSEASGEIIFVLSVVIQLLF